MSSGLLENWAVSHWWVLVLFWLHNSCAQRIPILPQTLSAPLWFLDSLVSAAFHTRLLGNEEQGFGLIYPATSLHQRSSIPSMSNWLCCWTQNIELLLEFMTSNCKKSLPLLLCTVVQTSTVQGGPGPSESGTLFSQTAYAALIEPSKGLLLHIPQNFLAPYVAPAVSFMWSI